MIIEIMTIDIIKLITLSHGSLILLKIVSIEIFQKIKKNSCSMHATTINNTNLADCEHTGLKVWSEGERGNKIFKIWRALEISRD